MAYYDSYDFTVGVNALLVSPQLTFTGSASHFLSFWKYGDTGWGGVYEDSIGVYYNSSASLTGAVWVATIPRVTAVEGWYKYSYLLPASLTGTQYIIFRGYSQYGNSMFLDDITLDVPPAHDAATLSIDNDTYLSSTSPTVPTALIQNFGVGSETGFDVTCKIYNNADAEIYSSTQNIANLNSYDTTHVNFTSFTLPTAGEYYKIKVYTSVAGDLNNSNDTIVKNVYALSPLDAALHSISFTGLVGTTKGLVGQDKITAITVKNFGEGVINSFDLSVTQNSGTPVVQSFSGLTLASLDSSVFTITTSFTLVSGLNTFAATISNVNGAGVDGDNTDNDVSFSLTPIVPAQGKKVFAEEATGTWCGWCPRGAVYMDAMHTAYNGYFAGVAVHNSDPMTLAAYNTAITSTPGFPGFPSAFIDRLPVIDPSDMETDFLTRIGIAPAALIVNGANYDAGTRILQVSLTSTIQSDITGNYKIACVITEDDVTGTTSTYAQHNYYSGGSYGVMGGFELLPAIVPAAQMHYNHVARFLSPSYAGISNAVGTSASSGTVVTYNFSFTLPATYDDTQINIIGLFIDPTGKIDNVETTTIPEAVSNGYVPGIGVNVVEIPSAPDTEIGISPNPSVDYSTITLNLKKTSTVQVAVYSADGVLIGRKDYGRLTGGMNLPVDMTTLKTGMYFVNVTIDNKTSVLKLIKK